MPNHRNPLVRFFIWIKVLFRKLLYYLFKIGGVRITNLEDGQCFTWDSSGVVSIPVTISGTLNPGSSHVFNILLPGPRQANGDYPYPGPIEIKPDDHGKPDKCQKMTVQLIEVDTRTTPETRTVIASQNVQLCPECGK